MQKTLNSDVEAPNVPLDGVSCIAVNGSEESFTNMLVMASWDGTVSAHEVTSKEGGDRRTFVEKIELKSHIKHEAPVLSCAVHNTTVVSGGCDRTVKMWDVAAGQKEFTLGTHQAPVRNVKFVSELGVVVTGGWDKCIKVWDPPAAQPGCGGGGAWGAGLRDGLLRFHAGGRLGGPSRLCL